MHRSKIKMQNHNLNFKNFKFNKNKLVISILIVGVFIVWALSFGALLVKADEPVEIPVPSGADDWANFLFGGNISLNIFNPANFQGKAGFWSLATFVITLMFPISFIVSIAAIAIGSIKMSMSQGDQGKMASGRKWFINGAIGFVSTVVFLLLLNLILTVLGVGSTFDLAQNLATCGSGENKQTLYQWKKDNNQLDAEGCTCSEGGSWSCGGG